MRCWSLCRACARTSWATEMSAAAWVVFTACGSGPEPGPPGWAANVAAAEVVEVVPAGDRTLLRVVEEQWDFWASVPALEVAASDHVWLGRGREATVDGRTVIVIDDV